MVRHAAGCNNENGGLLLNSVSLKRVGGKEESHPQSRIESAYYLLRNDIVRGKLLPNERLRVEHLKDSYNVGASTLREAIILIVADELVVPLEKGGYKVAPVSYGDVKDIIETRIVLEAEALRQAIEIGDYKWEERLIDALHKLSAVQEIGGVNKSGSCDQWESGNSVFHEALISACTSRWMRHCISILCRQSERYRRLSICVPPISSDLLVIQKAMVGAAVARKAAVASELLADYIRLTLQPAQEMPNLSSR